MEGLGGSACGHHGRNGPCLLQLLGGIHRKLVSLHLQGVDADAGLDQPQLFELLQRLQGRDGQLAPAHQHISPVGVDAHVPPEAGVSTPVGRIHIAHVGQGRSGKIKPAAIGRQQHLHHIRIVQLLSAEPIDGRQHLGGRLASDEGGGDGIDQGGVEEGLIALHIDDDGAFRCAVHRGQQLISHQGNAVTPGCAVWAGEEGRNSQAGSLVGQFLAIGAEHGGVGCRGLQATFQQMLEHRFATDFSDQLAGQAAGVQPGWDGENHCEGLIYSKT